MSKVSFSEVAQHAVADPMAGIFEAMGLHTKLYQEKTGREFLSLAAGSPDDALLPTELYGHLTAAALSTPGRSALNYTMPAGFPPLREAMGAFLDRQQVRHDSEETDVLITSGGMEALSLGAWMMLNPGDTVIAEGPGFAGLLSVFGLLRARVVQLPCDGHGITPEALEVAIKKHNPKLISLMPDYQNPTGALVPLASRQKIARLLIRHNLLALEDGAYAPLGFEGQVLPTLQSLAPANVLYATSVSKILAPAARIGALVGPHEIVAKAADTKSAFNMQASALSQAVVAQFLSQEKDHLQTQLAKLQATYRRRCDAMIAALQKHFPAAAGYTWTLPAGGMFLWLTGPESTNFTELFERALDSGIAYVPGNKFYAAGNTGTPHNAARLNFASTPEDKINEAVRRLAVATGLQ